MKNYGILLTPFSFLIVAFGLVLVIGRVSREIAFSILTFGLFLFTAGFARWIQGKDRKIFGQVLRPKAAARSTTIWAMFFFQYTPIITNTSVYLRYLNFPIPFPIAILSSGATVVNAGYIWLPAVFIVFQVTWLLFFILAMIGKIPKIINIYMNLIITVSLSFWLNFGTQFLIWTLTADKSGLVLVEQWNGVAHFVDLLQPFITSLGIIAISLLLMLRMLKNLQQSFSNLTLKGGQKAFMLLFLLLSYVLVILPMIFGIMISLENTTYIAPYVNFMGIGVIAIAIFQIVSTLIAAYKNIGRQLVAKGDAPTLLPRGRARGAKPLSFGLTTAIFVLIFYLAWAPIILPLADQGHNSKNNSVYNLAWNGWSNFRNRLNETEGYDVMCVQSSLSTLSQLDPNKHIILVVPGPNLFFNPASEIPYLLSAFKSNFSMFICDDHGTTESLLVSAFIASIGSAGLDGATPLTFFPKGILIDNASYYVNPTFPVIKTFSPHEITNGINEVVLGQATGFLGGELLSFFGWTYLGQTSGSYSFIDVNGDGKYDKLVDVYPFPTAITDLLAGQTGTLGLAAVILGQGIPLGGYAQATFSIKEIALNRNMGNYTYSSRVFCATDATWLNNELTRIQGYDNLQMGVQAIEWLACGRSVNDVIVVFDEYHLRPYSGRTELNSAASFGAVQQYVNWLSTNPILGLFYPILALSTLRRWIPKEGSKQQVQFRDLEAAEREKALLKFRTSSFFAQKINWYRTHKKYRQALLQLYRRLERKINRLLGDAGDRSIDAVMRAIIREQGRYITKDQLNRINQFLERMYALKANKSDIKDEREFENLFLEMSWISDHL